MFGSLQRILRNWIECNTTLSLHDRLVLPTEAGERQAEITVAPGIVRCGAKLLLEGLPRFFSMCPYHCCVALHGVSLGETEGPDALVIVERAWRQT